MRVLLLKPNNICDSIAPNLGLGYLASALRTNHQVRVLNGIRDRLCLEKIQESLLSFQPDLVGLQVYTPDLPLLDSYLGEIRRWNPSVHVTLGGPHPSSVPESAMDLLEGLSGTAFCGEAEIGLPMLAEALQAGRTREGGGRASEPERLAEIPGLIWRDGDRVVLNPVQWIQDLDSLAFPAWDLLQPQKYPPAPHAAFFRRFPVAPIIASRGCPFQCAFCAAHLIQGTRMRYRRVENVLEEIELLLSRYGIREIHMVDDNFTFRRDYVMAFCEEVHSRGLRFPWTCPNGVRLDSLDRELLLAMKSAGCYAVTIGIESGCQRVLDLIGKKISLQEIREKAALIRSVGLHPIGYFILGFPTETREEMRKTASFSLDLGLRRANFMLFHPYPGTKMYGEIETAKTRLKSRDEPSSFADVAHVPEGFTLKEMKNEQRKMFARFYLRPATLLRLLSDIRSPMHAYFIFKRMFRWMLAT